MYQQALTIQRLFHRMAQRNRAIGSALPGGLSLVQEQLLVELDADPQRSLRNLERLLKLDQSSISRLAAGLENRGFLRRMPDPEDRRRYRLEIAAAGRRVIDATDKIADQRLEEFCSDFTAHEVRELKHYFQMLADGLGEAPGIARGHEHPLRVEQRRLARAVGLLSDSYMKSGLAVSYWHLLAEICSSREALSVKSLSEKLGLAKNSISTLIGVLQKKALIKKGSNEKDARSVQILSTSKGQELLVQLEGRAAKLIEASLERFSKVDADAFCELLRRFVLSSDRLLGQVLARGRFRRADSEFTRAQARGFLVLRGVRERDVLFLPDTLFASQHLNIVLELEGEIEAAFQFERRASRLCLTCAGWVPSLESHLSELVLKAAQFAGSDSFEIAYAPVASVADEVHLPRSVVVNAR